MPPETTFSNPFAVWVTAWRAKYASDLFFRTSANIIALQGGFVLVCVAAFGLALIDPARSSIVFLGVILMALLCGMLLSKFALGPARDTARYQKLFISNIAHELRTPLSTIKTSSEVALLHQK